MTQLTHPFQSRPGQEFTLRPTVAPTEDRPAAFGDGFADQRDDKADAGVGEAPEAAVTAVARPASSAPAESPGDGDESAERETIVDPDGTVHPDGAVDSGDTVDVGNPIGKRGAGRRAGQTTIADEVVEKVAVIAVRKVPGVHDLGGAARSGDGADRTGGRRHGVSVRLNGRVATLAVSLVVEYGHPVYDVADQVREELADAVERMLGIDAARVDVAVEDVHLPEESA